MVTYPSPTRPTACAAAVPLQPNQTIADDYEDESYDDPVEPARRFLLFNAVPSWLVSLMFHTVLLIVMAMLTIQVHKENLLTSLELSDAEEAENLEEFEDIPEPLRVDLPAEEPIEEPLPESAELESELDMPPSPDIDSDPVAVELDPLGQLTAQRSLLDPIPGGGGGPGEGGNGWGRDPNAPGTTPVTRSAVAEALKWLAAHQRPDGSWSFDHRVGPCNDRCPHPGTLSEATRGATGMALLPFLGAGQTHREGKYQETVRRGLAYLLRNMKVQGATGSFNEEGGTMYSHGICTIVLTEAYGLTADKSLQLPAQLAINYIAYAQDPVGGGWRYEVRQPGDTSVVGWQLMAAKSGHMAYLNVPPQIVIGSGKFLDSTQSESGARYGYTGPGTGSATTSIGLLCRMYNGWPRDHGALQQGIAFLDAQGPSHSNMYYNYYATQVMRHYGGEEWERWNPKMRDWLVQTQEKQGHAAGSWYVAGDHGSQRGGRLYITSLATMTLEVYYRYLPIYRERAAEEDFILQ